MCIPGCVEAVRSQLSRRGFVMGAGATAAGAAAAVTPGGVEAARRSFGSVVDLTHTMSAEFPTYFGVAGIELQRQAEYKKDGFNLYWWRIIEHAGTHLDAPIHFSETGMTAEKIPPETLVSPLAVIDVAAKAAETPDYLLTREDIAGWEKEHGRLPAGCCVAMHSGWGELAISDPAKYVGRDVWGAYHFPGFAPEAAEWLIRERQVAGIAVDTLSLDNGPSKDFKTHYAWLPSGRWGLENVANLDKVPASGATMVVGLTKVKDATGGPTRLLALV